MSEGARKSALHAPASKWLLSKFLQLLRNKRHAAQRGPVTYCNIVLWVMLCVGRGKREGAETGSKK